MNSTCEARIEYVQITRLAVNLLRLQKQFMYITYYRFYISKVSASDWYIDLDHQPTTPSAIKLELIRFRVIHNDRQEERGRGMYGIDTYRAKRKGFSLVRLVVCGIRRRLKCRHRGPVLLLL